MNDLSRSPGIECAGGFNIKVFLEANRAKKEFLDGDDFKKRNILENLCWNLSIKERNIHTVRLKSPFDIMWKTPKNADFKTMCIYTTTLEPILAKIADSDELAASCRKAAAHDLALKKPKSFVMVPLKELNWNSILRNIREIKDLLQHILSEAGITPDFSTVYA